jgi:hypothetical protein
VSFVLSFLFPFFCFCLCRLQAEEQVGGEASTAGYLLRPGGGGVCNMKKIKIQKLRIFY